MKFKNSAKKLLAIIVSATLLITCLVTAIPVSASSWEGTVATSFEKGSGTATDPYLVSTPAELKLAVTSKGVTDSGAKLY